MRNRITQLVLIWLAWSIIIIGYMQFVKMRYEPDRPDDALIWSAQETNRRSNLEKPYLLEPLFNSQVAWDSEFYLSIATVGYDDSNVRLVEGEDGEGGYSLSYAFFPFYPYLMQLFRLPFLLFGLNPIAASVVAGLIISLLGTLAGMLALYDISWQELGEDGALRVAFMMLIFPTSFFFATVYTEGLFVGLAFGSLAFLRRKHWLIAAILAAFATWTRAIGGALLVPLLLAWVVAFYQSKEKSKLLWRLPFMFLPLLAYGLWRWFYGVPFDFVQDNWFGNGLLDTTTLMEAWRQILERSQEFPETVVIVVLGIGSIILATLSCFWNLRKYPYLALFGLLALAIPLTGGGTGTQSAIRYVLVVPTLWIMLGQWSRSLIFERSWTVFSILLLAMQAVLFSVDMWVS